MEQAIHSCKTVKHFVEKWNDPMVPFNSLQYPGCSFLTNTESMLKDDIEDIPQEKQQIWWATLVNI